MSLASMTDLAMRNRGRGRAPESSARGLVGALVTYIPTEVLAVYVAAVAAIRTPGRPPDTGQWVLLAVVLVLTPLATWGIYAIRVRSAGEPTPAAPQQWPWREMVIATVGFLLWAAALPFTPFEQFDWYRPGLAAVVLLVGILVIGLTAPLLRAPRGIADLPSAQQRPTEPEVEREPASVI